MADRPIRIQLRRTKGWRMPENTVKVDRSTKFGNPYLIERQSGKVWDPVACTWQGGLHSVRLLDGPYWYRCNLSRAEAAALSCQMFATEAAPSMDLTHLRGKNLACWCPIDAPCHADVLLELANRDASDAMPQVQP